jgi:hypothetical protein
MTINKETIQDQLRRVARLAGTTLAVGAAVATSGPENRASASNQSQNPLDSHPNPIVTVVDNSATRGTQVSQLETDIPATATSEVTASNTPTSTPTDTETPTATNTVEPSASPSAFPSITNTPGLPSFTPEIAADLRNQVTRTLTLESTKRILEGKPTITFTPSRTATDRPTVLPTNDRPATRTALAENKTATAEMNQQIKEATDQAIANAAATKTQEGLNKTATRNAQVTASQEYSLTQTAYMANGEKAKSGDLTPTPTLTPTAVEVAMNGPVEAETTNDSTPMTLEELKALSPEAIDGIKIPMDGYTHKMITDIPGLDLSKMNISPWKNAMNQAGVKKADANIYIRGLADDLASPYTRTINGDKIYPQFWEGRKGDFVLFAEPKGDGFFVFYITPRTLISYEGRGLTGDVLAKLAVGSLKGPDINPNINPIMLTDWAYKNGINVTGTLEASYKDPADSGG